MRNILITLLMMIPALVLGPIIKIDKHWSNQFLNDVHDRKDFAIEKFAHSAEFTLLGSFAAANQGPYKITGYQHNICEGTIAIMPLYRNAEGAAILKRWIETKDIRSGVILSGKIYPDFPQLAFTILQIKLSFNRLITNSPEPQPLLAFAESGSCQLAEKMINFNVT